MAVGVAGGAVSTADAAGFTDMGNGYDAPTSDTDWPNVAYNVAAKVSVWLGSQPVVSSCRVLLDVGVVHSGSYLIDLDGTGPRLLYCDLSDGYGWVFVGQVSGRPEMYNTWLRSQVNAEILAHPPSFGGYVESGCNWGNSCICSLRCPPGKNRVGDGSGCRFPDGSTTGQCDLGYCMNNPNPWISCPHYSTVNAIPLAVLRSSFVRLGNEDSSKWVQWPMANGRTVATWWNHAAGQAAIVSAAQVAVTTSSNDGATGACFQSVYGIMPLKEHGGSSPSATVNAAGGTNGGDLCMAIGVTSGSFDGFTQNGNGYDQPSSHTDWPNAAYNVAAYSSVWVGGPASASSAPVYSVSRFSAWTTNQNVALTTHSISGAITVVSNQATSTPGVLSPFLSVTVGKSYTFVTWGSASRSVYHYVMGDTGANMVWLGTPFPLPGGYAATTFIATTATLKLGVLWSGVAVGDWFTLDRVYLETSLF